MAKSLIQCTGSEVHTASSTVTYEPLAGALAANGLITSETLAKVITRQGGVVSQLYVEVSVNTNSPAATVKTRKGGVSQNQTATLTASTTGIFQDVTNSDTIAAGDQWNYMVTPGSAGNLTITIIQMTFAATTNTVTPLVAFSGFTGLGASIAYKTVLNGAFTSGLTSDATFKTAIQKAGVFKNLYCYITTASASTTHSLTLTDNAPGSSNNASALTTTCTANTTGFFEDVTNTVTVTIGHSYAYQFFTGATVTNLVTASFGVELESTAGVSLLMAANDVSAGKIFAKTTTSYNPVAGNLLAGTTTESFAQSYVRDTSFTIDNLGIMIVANGTTAVTNSVTLDKNAVATALTATFTTATGLVQDVTHSVTGFAATDLLSSKIINASAAGGTHDIALQWINMHVTGLDPTISQTVFIEWEES